jgi:putative FmdB family regulatory protein
MPIYEYRCKECEHEVEALQKLSDPPLVDCPACGKPALQKRVSAAGFQLKGSGWYVTDFRGGGAGKKAPKEGDKADAPAGDAAKSDAKTESTTKSDSATPAASTTPTTPSTSSES